MSITAENKQEFIKCLSLLGYFSDEMLLCDLYTMFSFQKSSPARIHSCGIAMAIMVKCVTSLTFCQHSGTGCCKLFDIKRVFMTNDLNSKVFFNQKFRGI